MNYVFLRSFYLEQKRSGPQNRAIADAAADLGYLEEIGQAFAGFQKYL